MQPIFAGDVQGCADEFADLVARAHAEFGGGFELWLVGDLVNRGPASLRVLESVRALADAGRARFVLGNHELALLRVALGLRKLRATDTFRDVLEAGGDWIDWLRAQPLVAIDRLGAERFAMVHAAVPPDADLDALGARVATIESRLAASREDAARLLSADPERNEDADLLARLTRCRSIDSRGRWSSREPARREDAWHARWSECSHHYGVVYGHWATQGLHVARGLRGLDSGCVYHGAFGDRFLSAWLPDLAAPHPFHANDERFWRIPARARYLREPA
jgi:bis(5'-nucleosyl)-tetraphosphatase (symmetrical)